jgi:hypothetical protein
VAVYFGDALALRAHELARVEDRSRDGMTAPELLAALARHGDSVRGDDPASVLRSALNRSQHLWRHPGRGLWVWEETPADPTLGISGAELADAAHAVARRLDPARAGLHYEKLAAELKRTGVVIRGPQAGSTLRGALEKSGRFVASPERDGTWTWR